jgi:small subunit ribosomal protein S20
MANSKQAKKRIRQTERRTEVNKNRRSRMRTFEKKVELALEAGDHKAAAEALKAAQPEIASSVNLGIMPKNRAARKISRLSARVKALSA